jgi:hypothetical protein
MYARKRIPDPEIINGQLVGHSIPATIRPPPRSQTR